MHAEDRLASVQRDESVVAGEAGRVFVGAADAEGRVLVYLGKCRHHAARRSESRR